MRSNISNLMKTINALNQVRWNRSPRDMHRTTQKHPTLKLFKISAKTSNTVGGRGPQSLNKNNSDSRFLIQNNASQGTVGQGPSSQRKTINLKSDAQQEGKIFQILRLEYFRDHRNQKNSSRAQPPRQEMSKSCRQTASDSRGGGGSTGVAHPPGAGTERPGHPAPR